MSLEKIKVHEVTEYKPSSLSANTYSEICADFINGNEVCLMVDEYRPTANDAVGRIIDYVVYAVCNYIGAGDIAAIRGVTDTIKAVLHNKGIEIGKINRPIQMRFSVNDNLFTVKARYL